MLLRLYPALTKDGSVKLIYYGGLFMLVNLTAHVSRTCASAAGVETYRPDIDGLRALAVLLVVFFHAGFGGVTGGFVGVDIFFVISGYLITGIIVRELDGGYFSFASFYARRIKRICPALFALLGLCAVAALFILIPDDLRIFGRSIVSTVLFHSNWHFYKQVGYFDGPAIEKPLLHTWSLAIEEQFYLIWPAAVFALHRTFRRATLPYVILAILILSLAAGQFVLGQNQSAVFYLLPYRAWELLLGAYIAVAPFPSFSRLTLNLTGLAGFASIAYAASAFSTSTPFPGLNALFPCAGATMLILAGTQHQTLSRTILSFNPLRFVGKISYSLYLIHWPMFSFVHLVLDGTPSFAARLVIIAASLALATLSFRYVETPARHATLRFSTLFQVAASAAAALIICGIIYHSTNGIPARAPKGVQIAFSAKQDEDAATDCRTDATPSLGGQACPIGASAQDMQYDFIVWGDSHARRLLSAFAGQAGSRGLAGLVISLSSCPPFINEDRVSEKCKNTNTNIQLWIEKQKKLKIVFLAGFWSAYTDMGVLTVPQYEGLDIPTGGTGQGKYAAQIGIRDTFSFLRSIKLEFAIVEDVPWVSVSVPHCAARARMFGRSDERCFVFPRPEVEIKAKQASSILQAVSHRWGIPIVETVHAFCEVDTCRTERDGVIFYSDDNHLNREGARYLGARLDIPWPGAKREGRNSAALDDGSVRP